MNQILKYGLWLLIITGVGLRLYKLGQVPLGYTWDEMGIVYDGWSLRQNGIDHLGHKYPLVLESFGDYKAPLLAYILAGIFYITRFNEIWIRIISAIAGIGLIGIAYGLAANLLPIKQEIRWWAAALVAVSPVLIHWSRVGFEANLALVLGALGFFLLTRPMVKSWQVIAGGLILGGSMLTYHSAIIVIPLLTWGWFWGWGRKDNTNKWPAIIITILISILALLQGFIYSPRAQQTLFIFNQQPALKPMINTLAANVSQTISADFWIKGKQETLRNMVSGFGPVYWIELPLIIIGLIWCLKKGGYQGRFLGLWLAVAFIPSLASMVSPHMLRLNFIYPVIQLLAAMGIDVLINQVNHKTKPYLSICLLGLIMVQAINYSQVYFNKYAYNSAKDFNYGYKEVLALTKNLRKSAKRIVFSDKYGQPYIYVLVYNRIKPSDFLAGALTNFDFRQITEADYQDKNLLISTPNEIDISGKRVLGQIKYPQSEQTAFLVIEK